MTSPASCQAHPASLGFSADGLCKDDLGDVACEEYLIQRGERYGGFTFEFKIEGEFDINKLQFKYYSDGLGKDEKPHISLNEILYDGEKKQFVAARDPIGIRPLY